MSHFAEINQGGVVKRVIVAEQDFIDSGKVGDPKNWIQTSFNTIEGTHKLGGTPLRKNYAGIGYTYDKVKDAFIPPKPFPSWTLDEQKSTWKAPKERPEEVGDKHPVWNDEKQSWNLWSEEKQSWQQ